MFYLKHLTKIINLFVVFIFLSACSEKKNDNKVVAKVNNSILTEEMLNHFLGNYKYNNKLREEFIRRWIETETLYNEAKEKGITETEEYNYNVELAKKEIAKGLLIKKFFEDYKLSIQESDLIKYYNKHLDEFRINEESYLISLLNFSNINDAEKFRLVVDNYNWESLVRQYSKEKKAKIIYDKQIVLGYEIYPNIIKNYIDGMQNNEISVVIKVTDSSAYIVNLFKIYNPSDIPEFNVIKKDVLNRYTNYKKEIAFKEYLNELYSKYEIIK